jgi:TolB-like protein/Flp pilus assembly protein TadD
MKRCPQCSRVESDEALKFCRVDGATLVVDSSSIGSEAGTAQLGSQSDLSEVYTNILPHNTNPDVNRATGPTTTLPAPAVSATHQLSTRAKRKWLIALTAVVLIVVVGIAGYWSFERFNAAGNSRMIESVAVLPFENKSGNADSEYLSDGLAESLIYRLSQLPNLKVSPTSSVMRYKGKGTDVTQIAKELDIDAVMSGRVTQRGDDLTIGVELINVRTNKLIWAEQYDRKMADLLATQREIAAAITQKLQLKLAGNDGTTKRYTDNNEAYQLYLKGRFHLAKATNQDIRRGIEFFDQAINLDPNFALAYQAKAASYYSMPSYPYMAPQEAVPQARTAIAKALSLDPKLAEAHTTYAAILAVYDRNWAEAEREFKLALELDPNLAITHLRYAWNYLSPLGRHDEAIAEMKRAMDLEPLSLSQGASFAAVLMYAGQFDAAIEQAKKTYDLDRNHPAARNWTCHTLNAKGRYADSLLISEKILQTEPTFAAAAYAYAKSGQRQKAEDIISKIKEIEKTRYVMNYWVAIVYVALGDKDAAFAELEKAYRANDWFISRLKVDPFMDSLRDDPRFKDLLKRMNLAD